MVRMLLIFSFLFNFTNFGFSNDEIDPIGEKSDLVLVKDRSRTTSMIKKGNGFFEVKGLFETEKGPEYQVDYTFKIKVSFYGERGGTLTLMVPKGYFGDSFWQKVRRGVIETSNLKVKLEEVKDRVNHKGIVYNDCPVLRIFDVKGKGMSILKELIALKAFEMGILSEGKLFSEEVEDLEAVAVTQL